MIKTNLVTRNTLEKLRELNQLIKSL